jgi:hypothetical protein
MITFLKKNQIIVVGTNLNGFHGAGAAKQAKDKFGLKERYREGICGQTYAFPTLGFDMDKRSKESLKTSVDKFFMCAQQNKDKEFLMTAVGTGIAGFTLHYMESLFKNPPANVVLPNWNE